MKNAKLLGIIAIIALIIFGMSACEDPLGLDKDGNDPLLLTASFTISLAGTQPYVGEAKLTATLTGNGIVHADYSVTWYKGTSVVYTNATTPFEYTPGEEGVFSAVVESKKTGKEKQSSGDITVKDPITRFTDYTWKTSTPFKPLGYSGGNDHDETITITKTMFKLDSTWDGTAANKTANNNANNEYLYLYISNWTKLTGVDLTKTWNDGGSKTETFNYGYTLTIDKANANTKTKGYDTAVLDTFDLFIKTDTSGNTTTFTLRRSGKNGSLYVIQQRSYLRQD